MKQLSKDKLIGKYFWISLIVVAILVAALLGVMLPKRAEGTTAAVYVGGDKVATLNIDQDYEQVTKYNGVVLLYGKGKIAAIECEQGRMCRHDAYGISCQGESIVCPLSQVVVEVE